MSDTLRHRGPDDEGIWVDENIPVVLAFRRLSILDLTQAGHQPMVSPHRRFVAMLNGEIYNYQELRSKLTSLGHSFRSNSDTEVMLTCFEEWGVEESLKVFDGMFAIVVWDCELEALFLARDRFGEKPVYYGWSQDTFLFGSELKSIRAHPSFLGQIDRSALSAYVRYNSIPAPLSIYKDIRKLSAGTFVRVASDGDVKGPYQYWTAKQVIDSAQEGQFSGAVSEAVTQAEATLRRAVRSRMVSDVPLGAFLSGGIDSSLISALMQSESSRPIQTFTVGFNEAGYDEADNARAVARHLKTDHTEFFLTPQNVLDVIPRIPQMYDEPFSDSSQIPTYLIAKLARGHVTVALTGDGGDELFGGYNRYRWHGRLWKWMARTPWNVKSIGAKIMQSISPTILNKVASPIRSLLPPTVQYSMIGDKLHRLAELTESRHPEDLFVQITSTWGDPSEVVIGGDEGLGVNLSSMDSHKSFIEYMMYEDTMRYLPDDILTKVDRATMSASLESRAPFLSPEVLEFAWSLPLDLKIRNSQGKWILRQLLKKFLPAKLFDRPKQGFGVPLDGWLRGPLREWADSLLAVGRVKSQGYFNADLIAKVWTDHLSGRQNYQYHVWNILMFQAWLESEQARESSCPAQVAASKG